MIIEELKLVNFRNYEELSLFPHEQVNLFFGPNGSGKTNLLEAIHYCALGKSHRVSGDQSTVRTGSSFAFSGIVVNSGTGRRDISVRLVPNENNKKIIQLDHKRIQRFSDMMGCLQCVIFSPEDLGLIREGPSVRRRYLDMMISQVNRGYFIALQQYRTGLEQRNALLKAMRQKGETDNPMLDVFEQVMSAPALLIIRERKKIIEELSVLAEETYKSISGKENESFQTGYHCEYRDQELSEEDFVRGIRKGREEDLRTGVTSFGPHRDDLNLLLNRKSLKGYASQGQVRTAALSLKLAQMKILRKISGSPPVLLLDDVMSELDRGRRTRLVSEISGYQTFITCTDEEDLELDSPQRKYRVSSVDGKANVTVAAEGPEQEKTAELKEPDFSLDGEE